MSPSGHGLRSLWALALTAAALWSVYAGLQLWNWSSQHLAFDRLLTSGAGQYSPPVPSPVLRLIWLASVLAAFAVLGVAVHRHITGNARDLAPTVLASGGLVVGAVSIWFTPSKFGFSGGVFIVRPSAEFDAGVLIAFCAAAAFVGLCAVLGGRVRRMATDCVFPERS